ncbi:hypothetical protein SLS62_006301 [Diatrype stigma]|uniref:Ankyrin n=1 Tax=Diatrype stigma TaxID=117547 RepID=A0AAN9UNG4_9PEZI
MVSLLSLPAELLSYVTRDLDQERDLAALSRSCQHMYNATIATLYRRVKDDPAIFHRAVKDGHIRTVKYLLAAGADLNVAWVQNYALSDPMMQLNRVDRLSPQLMRMVSVMDKKEALARAAEGNKLIAGTNTHDDLNGEEDFSIYEDWSDECDDSECASDEDSDEITSFTDYESGSSSASEDDHWLNDDLGDKTLPRQFYWTPLHMAVCKGHDEIVALLLDHGANIHALSRGFCMCTSPGDRLPKTVKSAAYPLWKPLHTAICHGQHSIARLLLERGASTNVSTRGRGLSESCVTALHSAAYTGLPWMVQFLITQGYQTDVECKDHLGMTPLSYAYYTGAWDSVDLLVKHGATPNTILGSTTLVKHACFYSRFTEALRLVELGADVHATLVPTEMPTLHCCCQHPYIDRPDVNTPKKIRYPPRAAEQLDDREKMVKSLIKAGANIDDKHGHKTPLILAAAFHVAGVVDILLGAGADATKHDGNELTALQGACGSNVNSPKGTLLHIVKALLPYASSSQDYSEALNALCSSRSRIEDKAEIAGLLLERGASGCLKNLLGQESFSNAIVHGNLQVANTLLDNGLREPVTIELIKIVDKAIQLDNPSGLKYVSDRFPRSSAFILRGRILFAALLSREGKCARFLIKAGAPVHYTDQDGTTSLIRATAFSSTTLARMLLERGADPNEISHQNHSPLSFPIIQGNVRMIRLLLDHGVDIHRRVGDPSTHGTSLVDLVLHGHYLDALAEMVHHEAWWKSTEAQRNDYVIRALLSSAGQDSFALGSTLNYLLGAGGGDPDTPCTALDASPLHLAVLFDQGEAVRVLMQHGADIHRKLAFPASIPFHDSTPFEYAIGTRSASLRLVEYMLLTSPLKNHSGLPSDSDSGSDLGSDLDDADGIPPRRSMHGGLDIAAMRRTEPLNIEQLSIDYMYAACSRHKPEVFRLLFGPVGGLDVNLRDADGNTPLAFFCTAVKLGLEDMEFTAPMIAGRSAGCVRELLRLGADVGLADRAGATPLDKAAEIMRYNGYSPYLNEVARVWNHVFVLEGGALKEKALDDA